MSKDSEKKPETPKGGAAADARAVLADTETASEKIAELADQLEAGSASRSTKAARILDEIGKEEISLLVPIIPVLAKLLVSKKKRVAQTATNNLPLLARAAPAKVAKQLDLLKASYEEASAVGRDGLVRTFAALCTASVAYQKRLEPVLTLALDEADGKTLLTWSQVVLPALKGEPHARARAVVERRMYQIPRAIGQKIADNLGVRLRHSYRA